MLASRFSVLAVSSKRRVRRYVAHQPGVVRPGQRLELTFVMKDGITMKQLEKMKARYYLDDALPAE